ncbi:ATP-binding cassette domain-containing protein [Paenibacillus koleovorans]|uniref:ATP-binding cassette domain-containing protein n=1 Tax=Paenibacillus koleovorans TaxID=121608 RepID=UPI000FDC5141|nr:ATP-binding cassette domain-containing protein [Paenibacillus koleovorans]
MNLRDYEWERVSVAYSTVDGIRLILDQIDLVLRRGEWLALVGRNGSGKSTLAKVAAGLLPISAGRIELGWVEQATVRMVLQNPEAQLIGETVEEDLTFTLEIIGLTGAELERRLGVALQAVGLERLRYAAVAELSGGQKQLLAIAGCIASEAQLIVFDEATSMLDPLARERLLETASQLHASGVAIVWVTHEMEELAGADRVIALDQGRVEYEGNVRRFFYADATGRRGESACERLGLALPFAIEAVAELGAQGVELPEQPLTGAELLAQLEVMLR